MNSHKSSNMHVFISYLLRDFNNSTEMPYDKRILFILCKSFKCNYFNLNETSLKTNKNLISYFEINCV